jgi:hypothetical protein
VLTARFVVEKGIVRRVFAAENMSDTDTPATSVAGSMSA